MIVIYLIILTICIWMLYSNKIKEGYNRDSKIKVYCINRLNRPDRREKFLEKVKKYKNYLQLDIEMVDAVDRDNLEAEVLSKLKPGELGCYLSHIESLLRLLSTQKDIDYGLIFEDDGFCDDQLHKILQKGLYKDYDMMILGHNYHDSKNCKGGICKDMNVVHGSHAYLINKKGANKLISKAFPITKPYDLFYVQKENGLNIGLLKDNICKAEDLKDCDTQ